MSQEKGDVDNHQHHFVSCLVGRHDSGLIRFMWATIPLDVGQHYGDVGRRLDMRGSRGCPAGFGVRT